MQVIITGGTGLIGSKLTQALTADGHKVIVLSRNPARYHFPEGVNGQQWDAKTAVGWGHLADGADAIVNLAGESIAGYGLLPQRWTAARKERILQSRLNAGQAVVEAITAAEKKPRVLIQASGIDYYGHVEGEQPVTEASPSGSGFLAGVTQQWEKSTEGVAEMGVRRAVMRTAIVLSMNGGPLPATVLPFKFFVGGPLGSGRQWWPWIHLHDKVRVIQFLLQNESATGVFNVCTPNPVPNKQFAKAIGKAMKRPSFIPAPAFALRLILGEMAAIVLDGRRAIPQRLQEMGFTFTYPEIDDALANLLD